MLEFNSIVAGILGTAITAFVAWFGIFRKNKTDEASIALSAWKELVEPMQERIDDLKKELEQVKAELKANEEKYELERTALLERIRELEAHSL